MKLQPSFAGSLTADLSPAEKAAQKLYPEPSVSEFGITGAIANAVTEYKRAAYIRGDTAGYARAKAEDAAKIGQLQYAAAQFIKEVDSVTPELDLYPDDLGDTRAALLRALSPDKEERL